jgi:uncharacterized membrane protein YqgA involved in biofilm formation
MRGLVSAVPFAGTGINVAAVVLGTAVGALIGHRLPERIRRTVIAALGLVTLALGIDGALEMFREPLRSFSSASVLFVMGSVLLGGVAGEVLGIEDGLEGLGERLRRRFASGESRFTEGFVVASLLFCVGPLAILGSIQDGLGGSVEILAVKAMLDGFAALAFASALGIGVGFSVLPLAVYQGAITLAARAMEGVFTPEMIAALTAAGGILVLAISLRLLDVASIRVGNLLPALVLSPLAVYAWQTLA